MRKLTKTAEVFWSGTEHSAEPSTVADPRPRPPPVETSADVAYSVVLRGTDPKGGSFNLAQKAPSFLTVSRNSAKSTGFTT